MNTIFNITLRQNNTIKKANFGLDKNECLKKVKEYRQSPIYSEFDIQVEEINEVCLHSDTVLFSNCCGHQMGNGYEDILICPECKEHCEIEAICCDCGQEL